MNADNLSSSQESTFGQAPILLILDARLSDGAIRLYVYMQWRAGQNSRNFEGRESIAEAVHISETTVTKRAAELEAADWIVIIRRRNKTGKSSNFYKVFDNQDECRQWRQNHQLPKPERPIRPRKARTGVGGRPYHKTDSDTNINSSSQSNQNANINSSSETNVNLSSETAAGIINSSSDYPDSVFIQTQVDPYANTPDGGLPVMTPSDQESITSESPALPEGSQPKPRDLLFELVVTRGFDVDLSDKAAVAAIRDKANWIASWCKGNEVSMGGRSKKKLPGCTPPLTVEGLDRFYTWFEKNQRIGKPETAPGMAKWVSRARQALGRRSGPATTQTPPSDPARDARIKAKTRALLEQMGGQS